VASAAVAGNVEASEGAPLAPTLGSFTPAAGTTAAQYTVTITWGDGLTSAGSVSAGSGGQLAVWGTHTFAEDGLFSATAAIAGPSGFSTTVACSFAVADAPLTWLTPPEFNATEGQSF